MRRPVATWAGAFAFSQGGHFTSDTFPAARLRSRRSPAADALPRSRNGSRQWSVREIHAERIDPQKRGGHFETPLIYPLKTTSHFTLTADP